VKVTVKVTVKASVKASVNSTTTQWSQNAEEKQKNQLAQLSFAATARRKVHVVLCIHISVACLLWFIGHEHINTVT
jgi:hypothetical protein